MEQSTQIFEQHRTGLFQLAYSMLGRVAPAQDAVQEAYLRWQKQDIRQIKTPEAFLTTVVSRICLDQLKSARNQNEQYIGPNLPEPVITEDRKTPEEELEQSELLSMAMLVVLEQLSPVQRAVFILREIFDYDYKIIGTMIDKSVPNCRKIAQRSRKLVREQRPRFENPPNEHHELVSNFINAVQEGDLADIEKMLTEDAILYSDGGGKVTAARKPIFGAAKIAKFLVGIRKSAPDPNWKIELQTVNGEPGMIVWMHGELYNAWSFHVEKGKMDSIYVVLNPDKLDHLKKQQNTD